MKYTVKFEGNAEEMEAQALKAVKQWLGDARYLAFRRRLVDFFVKTEPSHRLPAIYRNVRLGCWTQGVQGYWPQRAVAREVIRIVTDHRRGGY